MSQQDQRIIREFWYRLYPELRHFKSRQELRAVKQAFRKDAFAKRRYWVVLISVAVTAGVLGALFTRWLLTCGLPAWLSVLLNAALWALLGSCVSIFGWQRPYIAFVRRYLQDHGIAVCLKCGYDLRGQTEPRCPECGTAFDDHLLRKESTLNEHASTSIEHDPSEKGIP